jgi:porin
MVYGQETTMLRLRVLLSVSLSVAAVMAFGAVAAAQAPTASPSRDVEQITAEAQEETQAAILPVDRPVYRTLQEFKKDLSANYGINWALEDTAIYQHTSGGFDPDDAMVNTLGLFATWKIFRDDNGKDFAGLGFQVENRINFLGEEFPELTADLGTLWAPNDSSSDDYFKVNQLWWGQRLAEGRIGFLVGKIDPGSRINENRFAGSGNTQFFSQPFATNPGRSFPDNGLGVHLRFEPSDALYYHFLMSDSDAVSTESPFAHIHGRFVYAGEVGYRPTIEGLGRGIYRLMIYFRDADSADELGWSLSADQNLSDHYGVFLRYGGNDGDLNAIEHILSGGLSWLTPFGRVNDQAGIAASWTRPSDDDFRDEYSTEVYYRLQLTEGIELSGSTQLIVDPSAGDQDLAAVYGLRLRFLY